MVTKIIISILGLLIFAPVSAHECADTCQNDKGNLYIEAGLSWSSLDRLFKIGYLDNTVSAGVFNQNKRPSIKIRFEKKYRKNYYLGIGLQHSMKGFIAFASQSFPNDRRSAFLSKQFYYFEIPLYVSYHSDSKIYMNFEAFAGLTFNQLYRTKSSAYWSIRSNYASVIDVDTVTPNRNAATYYSVKDKFDYMPKVSVSVGGFIKPLNINPKYNIGFCYSTDIGRSFHFTDAAFVYNYIKFFKIYGNFSTITFTLRYQLR